MHVQHYRNTIALLQFVVLQEVENGVLTLRINGAKSPTIVVFEFLLARCCRLEILSVEPN